MPEEEKIEQKSFESELQTAYDLASNGMGVQLHTVIQTQQNEALDTLPDWAKDAYITSHSNYIGQPYVIDWLNPAKTENSAPNLSPHAEAHITLIDTMVNMYGAIHWAQMREAVT